MFTLHFFRALVTSLRALSQNKARFWLFYLLIKYLNWLPFVQEIKVNQCSLPLKRLQGQVPEYLETLKPNLLGLVMFPPEQPITREKLFTARGIIEKLRA